MLGLAFLFFSALTILLYLGWLALIIKLFRPIEGHLFIVLAKLLAATLLALAPLYKVLVYPLIGNECNLNGRSVSYSKDASPERDLVIEGQHYGLKSSFPVLEMFSAGRIDSVHFGRNTSYGESNGIVSVAQIYDGNGFDLRVAGSDNVACGPYYKYVSEQQGFPSIERNICLAFARSSHPESYLRVSKSSETRRSWRTAFHPIEWKNTKFDLVSPAGNKPIHELREFTHKGLNFPILLNLSSIGDFSCRAEKTPDIVLTELLPEGKQLNGNDSLSKEFLISRLEVLTNKFWKFDVPEKVFLFKVKVFDHNHLSSAKMPLSVTLNVQKQGMPILLEIMNNSSVDWVIHADQEQTVFVEQFVPNNSDTVQGVPDKQVWKFSDNEKKQNYLLMFYYNKIMKVKIDAIQQHRSCEVVRVPQNVTTTLVLDSCNK